MIDNMSKKKKKTINVSNTNFNNFNIKKTKLKMCKHDKRVDSNSSQKPQNKEENKNLSFEISEIFSDIYEWYCPESIKKIINQIKEKFSSKMKNIWTIIEKTIFWSGVLIIPFWAAYDSWCYVKETYNDNIFTIVDLFHPIVQFFVALKITPLSWETWWRPLIAIYLFIFINAFPKYVCPCKQRLLILIWRLFVWLILFIANKLSIDNFWENFLDFIIRIISFVSILLPKNSKISVLNMLDSFPETKEIVNSVWKIEEIKKEKESFESNSQNIDPNNGFNDNNNTHSRFTSNSQFSEFGSSTLY